MMKKKNVIPRNYLEQKPMRSDKLTWKADDNGIVTLAIENKGVMNRIAQKLFQKPKISYVHLDDMGSFVWPILDGEADILAIGEKVKEHFGDKAEPLYERLAKYFQILESYGFVTWNKE